MGTRYEIQTNTLGRRILVAKENVDCNAIEELQPDMFDAVYLEYHKIYISNVSLIMSNLAVSGRVTWLKPVFLDEQFRKRFSKYKAVVDGFATTINDKDIETAIGTVDINIEKFGISRDYHKPTSKEELFVNFCRYCLSRGQTTMSNSTNRYYAKGYTLLLNVIFGENSFIDTRFSFQQNLRDMGYITKTSPIDRLHVCPNCFSTQMIFLESCPKCKSSILQEEPVVHHFRCANVSPESSYNFDGDMRCPKCKQFLRHIGVDYDIPTTMFTCETCGNIFSNSHLHVECTHCKKEFAPEQLATFSVSNIEFTDSGIKAIVGNDITRNIQKTPFTGYSDFNGFEQSMLLMTFRNSSRDGYVVMVARVELPQQHIGHETQNMIVEDLLYLLPAFKLSMHGGYLFAMQPSPESDVEGRSATARKHISDVLNRIFHNGASTVGWASDTFVLRNGDNYQDFMRDLQKKS